MPDQFWLCEFAPWQSVCSQRKWDNWAFGNSGHFNGPVQVKHFIGLLPRRPSARDEEPPQDWEATGSSQMRGRELPRKARLRVLDPSRQHASGEALWWVTPAAN